MQSGYFIFPDESKNIYVLNHCNFSYPVQDERIQTKINALKLGKTTAFAATGIRSSNGQIAFSKVHFNEKNGLGSNGVFTAPEKGYYLFFLTAKTASSSVQIVAKHSRGEEFSLDDKASDLKLSSCRYYDTCGGYCSNEWKDCDLSFSGSMSKTRTVSGSFSFFFEENENLRLQINSGSIASGRQFFSFSGYKLN